ncbi:MAG TPA: class I adenylate-forming enzyme family protein [Acidimicrobiales bacterium]|nr:class I adenylate-forming enzyme family protein [Acidimicrobiales bacterium]
MSAQSRSIVDADRARAYRAEGWWADGTIADAVVGHASLRPDEPAYLTPSGAVTWSQVERSSSVVAASLASLGVGPGDRVAVWFADVPMLHVAFIGVERAGATIVGIGARAGRREVAHVLGRTGASVILTAPTHAGRDAADAVAECIPEGQAVRHLVLDGDGTTVEPSTGGSALDVGPLAASELEARRQGPDALYLINSTSGTTGLPKCVVHTQNRWHYFHTQAVANGDLSGADVFLGAVPAPFGFGLWTSHVTPLLLGAPTVLLDRFSPAAAFEAIEEHGVTVLCCVSTQFIMMLADPELGNRDLTSLRAMFTGGEAVPYERALEFERSTGTTILQFYGSNETGLLSGTTLQDTPERRLRTAGRIVPEMQVRLFEGDRDVTSTGRGQPACRGPATSVGYLDDDAANAQLFTADGWMLMGDICEIDDDGYLTVVGRTSDIIIRGGKNISAPQVEADVATHPAVAHVAVVSMPDPVFGERVCAYVELIADADLDLAGLTGHLASHGVSKELYPERLIVLDELPRSSGAKVAKGELREDIRRRLEAEAAGAPTDTDEPVGAH